jgi:hypothetical protein
MWDRTMWDRQNDVGQTERCGTDGTMWERCGTESAGLNRHIVGDERALQKRRSDSILASSLALLLARVIAEA